MVKNFLSYLDEMNKDAIVTKGPNFLLKNLIWAILARKFWKELATLGSRMVLDHMPGLGLKWASHRLVAADHTVSVQSLHTTINAYICLSLYYYIGDPDKMHQLKALLIAQSLQASAR